MVTICTTCLTFYNSSFCPHNVFKCFLWISEQTAIISLYNIKWLDFRLFCKNCGRWPLLPSCLSVCLSAWSNSAPTGRIFMKFYLWGFPKSVEKIQFSLKSDYNTGTFNKFPSTFLITSRLFVPIMWNVSDEICRAKRNTHLVFDNVFGKSYRLWDRTTTIFDSVWIEYFDGQGMYWVPFNLGRANQWFQYNNLKMF